MTASNLKVMIGENIPQHAALCFREDGKVYQWTPDKAPMGVAMKPLAKDAIVDLSEGRPMTYEEMVNL